MMYVGLSDIEYRGIVAGQNFRQSVSNSRTVVARDVEQHQLNGAFSIGFHCGILRIVDVYCLWV